MKGFHVRRSGFTLVELLVVIAIITVLMAIALPVMQRARETARRTQCIANLHSIAMALRLYRMEEGGYPGPYDPVAGVGGLNALYPRFLESRNALICPNDPIEDGEDYRTQRGFQLTGYDATDPEKGLWTLLDRAGNMYEPYVDGTTGITLQGCNWKNPDFFAEHYSSYNLLYNWIGYIWWQTDSSLPEDERYTRPILLAPGVSPPAWPVGWADNVAYWYQWFRWDPENLLGLDRGNRVAGRAPNDSFLWVDRYLGYFLGQQVYWPGYLATNFVVEDPNRMTDRLQRPLWDWAHYVGDPYGLPSASFPGLVNRNSPENTIVTRCPHHRRYNNNADLVLRLGGTVDIIPGPPNYEYDFARQTPR